MSQHDDGDDYAIQILNLWKSFGEREILRGVDLSVRRGETMVVIGGSGTGKSVTLKHIMGTLSPDQGTVLIDGEPVDRNNSESLSRIRRKLGVLFQSAALLNWLTVEDNVALPLRELTKMPESEIEQRVLAKLKVLDLVHARKLFPAKISGGMKKRVGLARALILEPQIILYDEPTSGLDPVVSAMVNEMIIRTQEEFNVTSIVVTHDMTSAYHIGHRIAMLYRGRVIHIGTPEETQGSENPVVRQFIEGRTGGPILGEESGQVGSQIGEPTESTRAMKRPPSFTQRNAAIARPSSGERPAASESDIHRSKTEVIELPSSADESGSSTGSGTGVAYVSGPSEDEPLFDDSTEASGLHEGPAATRRTPDFEPTDDPEDDLTDEAMPSVGAIASDHSTEEGRPEFFDESTEEIPSDELEAIRERRRENTKKERKKSRYRRLSAEEIPDPSLEESREMKPVPPRRSSSDEHGFDLEAIAEDESQRLASQIESAAALEPADLESADDDDEESDADLESADFESEDLESRSKE